jgi:hypothetical protein
VAPRLLLPALLAALPLGAPAAQGWLGPRNEAASEVWVGSAPSAPSAGRTRQVGEALDAHFGLGDGLTLDLALAAIWIQDADTALRRQSGERSQPAVDLGAGATWEANEHLTLELAGGYSPRSKLVADSTVAYAAVSGPTSVEALVAARSSSARAEIGASWDSAGDSALEGGVELGLGGRRFDTEQEVVLLRDRQGQIVTPQQLAQDLQRQCQGPSRACPRQLLALLQQPRPRASLGQLALRVAAVGTLWRDTDLGLEGARYLYDRDPTEVGYFSLASASSGGASFGSGIPMAPLAWSLRPFAARRIGAFLVRAWWDHGAYVESQGALDTAGLKVQLRLGRGWRVWAAGSMRWDRDREAGTARSATGALGALVRW